MKYAIPQKKRIMVTTIPNRFSRLVDQAAEKRMRIVIGTAAIVRDISAVSVPVTMTKNWTVNPRKKKKSNFRRAM